MNNNSLFSPIPCGETLPLNNIHAVSVSMPCLQDVIDYEEGKSEVIDKMKSGYPRFFQNQFVKQLTQFIKEKHTISDDKKLIPITSIQARNCIVQQLNNSFCPEHKLRLLCFLCFFCLKK